MMISRCQAGLLLPGLRRHFQLVFIHAFINHTRYFDISLGQPANARRWFFTDLLFKMENQGSKEKVNFSGILNHFSRDAVAKFIAGSDQDGKGQDKAGLL